MGRDGLGELAHLHEMRAWEDGPGPGPGPGAYASLRDRLYVRAMVSEAGCPPVTELLPQRPGFPPLAVLLAVALDFHTLPDRPPAHTQMHHPTGKVRFSRRRE